MMHSIEILVEHCRGSMLLSSQGPKRLPEDWELMAQFNLNLQLEVVHK